MLRGYLESCKGCADISEITEIAFGIGSVPFSDVLNGVCPVFKVAPTVLMSSNCSTVCCVRLACRVESVDEQQSPHTTMKPEMQDRMQHVICCQSATQTV